MEDYVKVSGKYIVDCIIMDVLLKLFVVMYFLFCVDEIVVDVDDDSRVGYFR